MLAFRVLDCDPHPQTERKETKMTIAFPVPYAEVLARAKSETGTTYREKIYNALRNHSDTADWLQTMKPHAFQKGAAVKATPTPKSRWEAKARTVVIDAVFATAKTCKGGETRIPGRVGKVFLTQDDMLDPAAQYELASGDVDLTALAALHKLRATGYTLDAERIQLDAEYAERQKDWSHGEHPLQAVDGNLKTLGIYADDPRDAVQQLLALNNPDPELLDEVQRLANEYHGNPERDYGTFKTTAWYTPDHVRGNSIRAKALPTGVRAALKQALLVTGKWESLNVPRQKKGEAFDRLVDLFEAALKRLKPKVVAANTDDLIGKAAIMAANRLKLPSIAVQLASWDFKPAQMQFQYCEQLPYKHDVQLARNDQSVTLADLVPTAVTVGDVDEVLTHNLKRRRRSVRSLTHAWVEHSGI